MMNSLNNVKGLLEFVLSQLFLFFLAAFAVVHSLTASLPFKRLLCRWSEVQGRQIVYACIMQSYCNANGIAARLSALQKSGTAYLQNAFYLAL